MEISKKFQKNTSLTKLDFKSSSLAFGFTLDIIPLTCTNKLSCAICFNIKLSSIHNY